MKVNVPVKRPPVFTAEGAPAKRITPHQELARTVACCMLWENNFYESGQSVAERIAALVPKCDPEYVYAVAHDARTLMKLRHAPLLVAREMARSTPAHRALVAKLLEAIVQRPDELTEFLAIYWKDDHGQPLSAQVKKGLRAAFNKFNEYSLAKYNRKGAVNLRDVAFLTHVAPKDGNLVARLVNRDFIPIATKSGYDIDVKTGEPVYIGDEFKGYRNPGLETPDTWETELSAGKDKLATWTRLLAERKLGALAFLRNLRNMQAVGVPKRDVAAYGAHVNLDRVLPFRFIAAARAVPQWEDVIEPMMLRACEDHTKLPGHTVVLLDISPSMGHALSAKSDLSRRDAALGVAVLLREICEEVSLVAFSTGVYAVPPRRGFALAEAIAKSGPSNGTLLGRAVASVNPMQHDRLIVLTDEESQDPVGNPAVSKAYMINVASSKNGVGYGAWNHIDGWSESVIDFIELLETSTF